jgi:hypothetical protein
MNHHGIAPAWRRLPPPVRRGCAAVAGGALLLAGLAMLVLPGPGLLAIGLGLAVLGTEFPWSKRLLDRASSPLPAAVTSLWRRRHPDA